MSGFREASFLAGCTSMRALPQASLPEVALAGRSNVGKSSLMNALTQRKALARTSHTPGRTQQLNFFRVRATTALTLMLVDLPGYGYAKAPASDVAAWQALMRAYVQERVQLRRVYVLLDARREQLSDADEAWIAMLDAAAVPYRLTFTKADKVSPAGRRAREAMVARCGANHPAALPQPLWTSSQDGSGLKDLRRDIAAACAPA